MLAATAKPSRVSRERKSAQPVRVGIATRTHRKISSVMSQIKIQVIFFYILVTALSFKKVLCFRKAFYFIAGEV